MSECWSDGIKSNTPALHHSITPASILTTNWAFDMEYEMKIGLMNNPAKSVYEEIKSFGKNRFDFVDLTIEGPNALNIDTAKALSILDRYNLSVTGHTDPCLPWAYPIETVREACFKELQRCAEIFSRLGAKIMNIHPCYFCPPALRNSLVEFNIEALKQL